MACAPLFLGARCVLVRPHDRAVDHQFLHVRILRHRRRDTLPYAFVAPPRKTNIYVVPRSELWWQIPPRSSRAAHPEHCFGKETIVFGGHTAVARLPRQQIHNSIPLVISQNKSIHRRHLSLESV
jgi:hypothetical protein